jgi:hypothetical protein
MPFINFLILQENLLPIRRNPAKILAPAARRMLTRARPLGPRRVRRAGKIQARNIPARNIPAVKVRQLL